MFRYVVSNAASRGSWPKALNSGRASGISGSTSNPYSTPNQMPAHRYCPLARASPRPKLWETSVLTTHIVPNPTLMSAKPNKLAFAAGRRLDEAELGQHPACR